MRSQFKTGVTRFNASVFQDKFGAECHFQDIDFLQIFPQFYKLVNIYTVVSRVLRETSRQHRQINAKSDCHEKSWELGRSSNLRLSHADFSFLKKSIHDNILCEFFKTSHSSARSSHPLFLPLLSKHQRETMPYDTIDCVGLSFTTFTRFHPTQSIRCLTYSPAAFRFRFC